MEALDGSTNEHLDALFQLAKTHYEREDYLKALPLFQKLTMVMPKIKEYWFGFASTLMMQKKYDKAVIAWQMCALLDGEDVYPHFHAAECYYSLKEFDQGIKALNAARLRTQDHSLVQKMNTLEKRWKHAS